MAKFEDAGRAIDREVEKLRRYFEQEVKPKTKRQMVSALRAASKRLTQLARQIESQGAIERATKPEKK